MHVKTPVKPLVVFAPYAYSTEFTYVCIKGGWEEDKKPKKVMK